MCSIAFEHAESLKILVAARNLTSATGLLRLQYEALVRSMWLKYSASDQAVSSLMAELTHESEKLANKLPMLSEMLKQLEGKAPREAIDMLLEFKEYSWKPLNSFVHGGIHAINRHSVGYPLPLLEQLLKASNGVSLMAGMMLIMIANSNSYSAQIQHVQRNFVDCLPPEIK